MHATLIDNTAETDSQHNSSSDERGLTPIEGVCGDYCPNCGSTLRDDARECPRCRKGICR
ncbi:zinc-ribbon domain-containing protein [Halomarina salina]|uniref:Zinc-ribbon domain-containing protein n=1 Tax=Halomarina salina TaxID=1872699 RepID=A0ABD5RTK6_9EURY